MTTDLRFPEVMQALRANPRRWLVTGVAGFIGSNLLETLLKLDQYVVGLDNFETGHHHNLRLVQQAVCEDQWSRFEMVEGDIQEPATCQQVVTGVEYVLHQAALGSVPRSIEAPLRTNQANVTGFLNMLDASRQRNVTSFTYAASSSTYGDHPGLPKVEDKIGRPLSPYAVTKYVNELYADVYARTYDFRSIGLRYFNVYGPRQDPNGAYAAVIPRWIDSLIQGKVVNIFGDGKTSRDFCYVDNVVQANILSAVAPDAAKNRVYNVAVGERTTLLELFELIHQNLTDAGLTIAQSKPEFKEFRKGDVRHSLADIRLISDQLAYRPTHTIRQGMKPTVKFFLGQLSEAP